MQECLNDPWIKLASCTPSQFYTGLGDGAWIPLMDSLRGHRIIGIHDCQDTSMQWDVVCRNTSGIAMSIPAFMMRSYNACYLMKDAPSLFQDLTTDVWMTVYNAPLRPRKWSWLAENHRRDADFPNIMEHCSQAKPVNFLLRLSQLTSGGLGKPHDPLHMIARFTVIR
jgi:hypothetical protein